MIEADPRGSRLRVYLQPQASKNRFIGAHNGALKIQIQAPALENKANEALLSFLADEINLPRKKVHLLTGQTHRNKLILFEGLALKTLEERLKEKGLI